MLCGLSRATSILGGRLSRVGPPVKIRRARGCGYADRPHGTSIHGADFRRSARASLPDGRVGARRAVLPDRAAGRGRHGQRLAGRAVDAGPARSRGQADPAGACFAGGAGPVRGRAAGVGDDGPRRHRHDLGWGPRGGRSLLRDGAGAGRTAHPLLRSPPAWPGSPACGC